jgi:hypothetical protein
MANVVIKLESGNDVHVWGNTLGFHTLTKSVTSRYLTKGNTDLLRAALNTVTQWAAAGMDYFILFTGVEFILMPYGYGEELRIPLTKEERELLAHILSL